MILRNCRLIPELSEKSLPLLADVEITGKEITAITAARSERPMGKNELDGRGKTLLPGLFDLHAHLSIASAEETPEAAMEKLLQALPALDAYTDLGVTFIRDCGSCLRLSLALRKAIEEGWINGPQIQAAGYMIAPPEMEQMGTQMTKTMTIADTEAAFRQAAEQEIDKGADFVKIYASGSASKMASAQGSSGAKPIMTRGEIRAAVEAAKAAGTYVSAHAHAQEAIKSCIAEGVRTIEHATFLDEETADRLRGKKDTWLVPTLAVMVPEENRGGEDPRQLIEAAQRIAYAYRAGLKLGFGTDLYNGRLSRFFHEFRIRRELCGMREVDILLQATRYSAEIAGVEKQTGTIGEGLQADLLLADGNPDQDISVMYRKPLMVFQRGERRR